MGSPKDAVMEMFIRKEPLSKTEMYRIIEGMVEILLPEFKKSTLPEIGKLKNRKTGKPLYEEMPEPLCPGKEFQTLRTQACFGYGRSTEMFWALTRDGTWLFGILYYPGAVEKVVATEPSDDDSLWDNRVKHYALLKSNISEVVSVAGSAWKVALRLVETADELLARAKTRYEGLEATKTKIHEFESLANSLIAARGYEQIHPTEA